MWSRSASAQQAPRNGPCGAGSPPPDSDTGGWTVDGGAAEVSPTRTASARLAAKGGAAPGDPSGRTWGGGMAHWQGIGGLPQGPDHLSPRPVDNLVDQIRIGRSNWRFGAAFRLSAENLCIAGTGCIRSSFTIQRWGGGASGWIFKASGRCLWKSG